MKEINLGDEIIIREVEEVNPGRHHVTFVNLYDQHTEEEMVFIMKGLYKFLQSDSPAKAIFDLRKEFGMQMHRAPNGTVYVQMEYGD